MQITTVQTEVTQNTQALKGAQVEVSELRRTLQTLEIELESQRSLVRRTASVSLRFVGANLLYSLFSFGPCHLMSLRMCFL